MTKQNLDDATTVLAKYQRKHPPGTYTLDTMRALMDYLGNPQDKLRVIHVAGTSGKTSTSYYAAALLKEQGYTVGLTVSPHVIDIRERTQINLDLLPENTYCMLLDEFLHIVAKSGLSPSYYEVLVAFSFWVFVKYEVDFAVVEVGLGGLLDGTNVINRTDKVCVITDIGLDHTDILGDTIIKITEQKAGIIQTANSIVMHRQTEEVMTVVQEKSKRKKAKLILAMPQQRKNPSLPLYQRRNFSLAVAAAKEALAVHGFETLSDTAVIQTLDSTVPGRFEIFTIDDRLVILDGAHNPQKMKALVDSIESIYPKQKFLCILAYGKNKLYLDETLEQLQRISKTVICTEYVGMQDEPRMAHAASELASYVKEHGISDIHTEIPASNAIALALKNGPGPLLITGSLYLVKEARPLLKSLAASQ